MFNSKLLSILETFDKKDVKQCLALVSSPFFNKNKSLIQLYEYCIKSYPDFSGTRFKREIVYKKLYPQQKFDDGAMRYLMSDLTKLLEQFLIQQSLKQDEKTQIELLLEAKENRNLNKYFRNTFDKHQKKITKSKIRNLRYFQHQLNIQNKLASIEFSSENHSDIDLILKAEKYLDKFYVANKLRYACLVHNYRMILKAEYNPIFTQRILDYAENSELIQTNPLIHTYYLIYQMIVDEDGEEYYNILTKQMEDNVHIFEETEAKNIYSYLRNHCIGKINLREHKYYEKLLDLYKTLLENNLILSNKYLSQWDYLNICQLGIRVNQVEFSESFIKKYQSKLKSNERENAYTYASAFLQFNKNNYDKTLQLLNTVSFNNPYYHLFTKTLLIKTYYELEEIIPLQSTINAFSIWIKRNKQISKFQKTIYSNFISYIKKLMKLKLGSKIDLTSLIEKLKNEKHCADIIWVNKKMEDLKQRSR